MKIILTFLVGIIIGIIGFQTYYNIDNSIPDGFADKWKNCPVKDKCPECYPFKECDIEIKNPVNVMLNCNPYLQTIKALNFRISDLKASNEDLKTELKCFKDSYISWESYKCN